jgi:hypothetical protein
MSPKVDAARLAAVFIRLPGARLPDRGVMLRGRQAMTLHFVANEQRRSC